MRALPTAAVMERKMFKAEKNSFMPAGDALSVWFSLLVYFPSPVKFAIVLGGLEIKHALKSAYS